MHPDVSERPSWPSVAVIVPVFNDSKRLARCLDALAVQTYPADRYRILVVDNGSSDDIAGVCRAFARVHFLHERRPGSYAARNKGVESTDAHILAFTDSDCIPHPDWLEKGVACLRHAPACDIVGGSVVVFPEDRSRRTAVELFESAFAFPQGRRVEEGHWSATANLFVRRSVFEAVGPFRAELLSGGDAEWGRRAHAAGHRIAFADDARVDHPARGSLRELLAKARRVAGGARAARHDTSKRQVIRYLARSAYRSARRILLILARGRFDAAAAERFTMVERLKISAVQILVTISRLTEVVRLRFTRRPAKRT